jgi:hypothetical protein
MITNLTTTSRGRGDWVLAEIALRSRVLFAARSWPCDGTSRRLRRWSAWNLQSHHFGVRFEVGSVDGWADGLTVGTLSPTTAVAARSLDQAA